MEIQCSQGHEENRNLHDTKLQACSNPEKGHKEFLLMSPEDTTLVHGFA